VALPCFVLEMHPRNLSGQVLIGQRSCAYKLLLSQIDASPSHFCRAENGVPGEAIAEAYHNFEQGATSMAPMTAAAISNQTIQESMRLLLLVRAYQVMPSVWRMWWATLLANEVPPGTTYAVHYEITYEYVEQVSFRRAGERALHGEDGSAWPG